MWSLGLDRLANVGMQPRLLVVNYHRLRPEPGAPTLYDDGVFDTDALTFRRQMEWLKQETIVLDEEGLQAIATRDTRRTKTVYSAVTFDDGYIDCISVAKPVLDEFGIRGIFFVPVEMIESRRLGWWDLAANLLKRTRQKQLSIDGYSYDLERDFSGSLQGILKRFKREPAGRTALLIDKLATACDVPIAEPAEQDGELMTWENVRKLQAAGHAIGAHSMTHRVLATLDVASQTREIGESRRCLENILGSSVRSFAYPVGGPEHINADSVRLVREAGYELAFTFNTGVGAIPLEDRFQVPRESAKTFDILKAKVLLPGLMRLPRRPPLPVQVSP